MEIARILGILFGIILVITMPFFIFLIVLYILGIMEITFMEGTQDLLTESNMGWMMILFPGIITLISLIMLVIAWMLSMRWKDLRYKMAFFLYHSKMKSGERIPLKYLAKVGVCSEPEIKRTLEIMVSRKELKGRIDEIERVYIHKRLTRRGMKFLMALPPAKLNQLQDVRKWALKGHAWAADRDNPERGIPELEEVEIEELPAATAFVNKEKRETIACPNCGRMNVKEHHFCTYCGEII